MTEKKDAPAEIADVELDRVHGAAHVASLTQTTIPALDGSSKDPAYFTVKIDPERLRKS